MRLPRYIAKATQPSLFGGSGGGGGGGRKGGKYVPKKVQAQRDGTSYTTTVWVDPNKDKPTAGAKQGDGGQQAQSQQAPAKKPTTQQASERPVSELSNDEIRAERKKLAEGFTSGAFKGAKNKKVRAAATKRVDALVQEEQARMRRGEWDDTGPSEESQQRRAEQAKRGLAHAQKSLLRARSPNEQARAREYMLVYAEQLEKLGWSRKDITAYLAGQAEGGKD